MIWTCPDRKNCMAYEEDSSCLSGIPLFGKPFNYKNCDVYHQNHNSDASRIIADDLIISGNVDDPTAVDFEECSGGLREEPEVVDNEKRSDGLKGLVDSFANFVMGEMRTP